MGSARPLLTCIALPLPAFLPSLLICCQVNKYPSQRVFTAIGTGGDDFKDKMKKAVEDVVGTVHLECVSERPSSGGKYVSVRIGPVWVETADQVGGVCWIMTMALLLKEDFLFWGVGQSLEQW